MSTTETYQVVGMTCDHCASSVKAEICEIQGVADVAVDLPTGQVAVTADQPISTARIREAVEEAGYALAH